MNLAGENLQVINLVQAMIGAITPNLRRATLELASSGAIWLRFVLERDDQTDREELNDIAFEFEALQARRIELHVEIIIDARPIEELNLPGRTVFGRKE